MKCLFFAAPLVFALSATAAESLRPDLERTYTAWRDAMVRKDTPLWQRATAAHRQMEVRNRILSEKRPFPAAVFELPAPPPSLDGLKFLNALQNGLTAKAAYFGKIDFGVGGAPTENLLVLSFIKGSSNWLYDRADFINLSSLPEVRKELAAGDLNYLKETPEAQPDGKVPPTPIQANPAKYVAKVYVFCPGREVKLQVNKISRHRFANAKEAQIVIGGAVDGLNEVQYSVTNLEGGTGAEVMTIRVYLMPEAGGTQPIKAFQYQLEAGEKPKPFGTGTFSLDPTMAAKLSGR